MVLEYEGTAYVGWQRQPDGPSIQERIEECLERITGQRCPVVGAGRTDAGVHARGQVAAFSADSPMAVERFHMALNALLPRDIVIREMEEAPVDFNPRFAAKSKRYRYAIWSHRVRPVFDRERCWHMRWPLDMELMREATSLLVGKHDFGAFEASGSNAAHSVRTVHRAEWSTQDYWLYFDIEGDGFLYNMVRSIVGSLVDVGRGKMPLHGFREGFESRDRRKTGPTAPARGLCLMEVRY